MAGTFVTLVNPGYSALFTRDLSAASTVNVEGSTSMNLFDPDSAHPLQEGEWLQINSAYKFQRPAGGDVTGTIAVTTILKIVEDAQNTASLSHCSMNFQERGRYDSQVTKKAHCIVGPGNFEFRTKMIVCAAGDEGEKVFVYICQDSSNRLVSALVSASAAIAAVTALPPVVGGATTTDGSWYAGVITRIHGTNDATVLFQPGFL